MGSRLINARAETAIELPSFRTAFTRRRCLVLADGFYEWRRVGSSRIPMRIVMKSGEPFAFAGLWDTWRDPEGEMVRSCTHHHDRAQQAAPADSRPDARDTLPGCGTALAGRRPAGPPGTGQSPDPVPRRSAGGLPGLSPGEPAFQRRPRMVAIENIGRSTPRQDGASKVTGAPRPRYTEDLSLPGTLWMRCRLVLI